MIPATFGGILLRYVFADELEIHLFLHELFRPHVHKVLEHAIKIHGKARVEEPRPGRFV
jgi:hypothetical protein